MRKCLEAANGSSYTTLVFPAMGTGQLGYPRDQVAEMMYQTVIDFDRKSAGPNLKHIKFICFPGDFETCEVKLKHIRCTIFHSRRLSALSYLYKLSTFVQTDTVTRFGSMVVFWKYDKKINPLMQHKTYIFKISVNVFH